MLVPGVLSGQLLHDLEPLRGRLVDPENIQEKRVVREDGQTSTRMPSLLSETVDNIPRAVVVYAGPSRQADGTTSEAQLATLPFNDRVAAVGADGFALPARRPSRARTAHVRLIPLPDDPARLNCPVAAKRGAGRLSS